MIFIGIGLGLLGLAAMKRAHMHHHGYGRGFRGHHGWHRHHHHHGWGGHHDHDDGFDADGDDCRGRFGGPRRMLRWVFRRLDTTPAQETVIRDEVRTVMEHAHAAKRSMRAGRSDIAQAIRAADLDSAAAEAVWSRGDAAWADLRTTLSTSLAKIHAVLDDKQRAMIADLLERRRDRGGPGPRGPQAGVYR